MKHNIRMQVFHRSGSLDPRLYIKSVPLRAPLPQMTTFKQLCLLTQMYLHAMLQIQAKTDELFSERHYAQI